MPLCRKTKQEEKDLFLVSLYEYPVFVHLYLDLRWVQVNSAEEAYKVMKMGKKNQSFSSTRLNQLSSRRWGQQEAALIDIQLKVFSNSNLQLSAKVK